MNDIEKAISSLIMENELMQFDPNTGEDYPIELQNQDNQDLYKANLVAINALEKQLLKKVIKVTIPKKYGGCVYKCPACDKLVKFVRCLDCGQRLDWEVENE